MRFASLYGNAGPMQIETLGNAGFRDRWRTPSGLQRRVKNCWCSHGLLLVLFFGTRRPQVGKCAAYGPLWDIGSQLPQ